MRIEQRKRGVDISFIKPTDIELSFEFDYHNATKEILIKHLPNYPRKDKRKLGHIVCKNVMFWCNDNGLNFDSFYEWYKKKDKSKDSKMRYEKYWIDENYSVNPRYRETMMELFYPKLKKKVKKYLW